MKTKLVSLIFTCSLLAASAFGWPWGNVGIGTTEMPQEKLHVSGNVLVENGLLYFRGITITNAQGFSVSAILGADVMADPKMTVTHFITALQKSSGCPTGVWFMDWPTGSPRMLAFADAYIQLWGYDSETTSIVSVATFSLTPD